MDVPPYTVTAAEIGPGVFVVSATGPLRDDAIGAFRDALLPLAAADGANVAVDLVAAAPVDALLIAIVREAAMLNEEAGGRLTVVTQDPYVRTEFPAEGHTRLAVSLAEAVAA